MPLRCMRPRRLGLIPCVRGTPQRHPEHLRRRAVLLQKIEEVTVLRRDHRAGFACCTEDLRILRVPIAQVLGGESLHPEPIRSAVPDASDGPQ
jgi:hypothetical protein